MRAVLAVLCVGAVTFLLRVLTAFVKEGQGQPPTGLKAYMARFNPPRRRAEMIVMKHLGHTREVRNWGPEVRARRSGR